MAAVPDCCPGELEPELLLFFFCPSLGGGDLTPLGVLLEVLLAPPEGRRLSFGGGGDWIPDDGVLEADFGRGEAGV